MDPAPRINRDVGVVLSELVPILAVANADVANSGVDSRSTGADVLSSGGGAKMGWIHTTTVETQHSPSTDGLVVANVIRDRACGERPVDMLEDDTVSELPREYAVAVAID